MVPTQCTIPLPSESDIDFQWSETADSLPIGNCQRCQCPSIELYCDNCTCCELCGADIDIMHRVTLMYIKQEEYPMDCVCQFLTYPECNCLPDAASATKFHFLYTNACQFCISSFRENSGLKILEAKHNTDVFQIPLYCMLTLREYRALHLMRQEQQAQSRHPSHSGSPPPARE